MEYLCAGFCMNIIFQTVEQIPRSMIPGLHCKTLFSFVRTDKLFSEVLVHFTFPPAINRSFRWSASSQKSDSNSFTDFSHCNRYIVLSHYCVNFKFLNDK